MPHALADTNLFKPIKVGKVTLKNRLAYAPTTRNRNTTEWVPTDSMREYYAERAENNGGLLIAEATSPSPDFGYYANTPMIDTPRQVAAWKKIVDEVHSKGSYMSLQLWHLGRAANPKLLKDHGIDYVGPSPIYIDDTYEKGAEAAGNPLRAMTVDEIHAAVKSWAKAAKKAVDEAGFDFVEIHAAHMYLLDQFIQAVSNHRTDEYGGSIENRSRFALEVVDAMIDAVGAEHVAIRLSPYVQVQGGEGINAKINPIVTWGYILSELERRAQEGNRIGYVSFIEPRFKTFDGKPNPSDIGIQWATDIWKGVFVITGALLHDPDYTRVQQLVNANDRTIIGSSRYYTSNPDLANRLKNGYPLTHYDRPTFYNNMSNYGYITWGKYGEENLTEDSDVAKRVPKALA
ncbi:hypothetical protein HII13_004182 [Brettanomyces bruxellensis]|uniref:DEBR0S2_01530g1_1 n=1 Tax=Dekkera bruxellensis TaxID=5007 RepID=A0A7D9GYN3_DEKBR|nr:hypothetical protein HII13_004182 [Brettanomyces bruxellensis]VUG17220.1 OYE2 [Brettanomyces bruxellensis]